MKVFITTSGEYSDTSISGVFSSHEKAQSYIDANHLYDDNYFSRINDYIEEYEVDNASLPTTVIASYDTETKGIVFSEDNHDEDYPAYYDTFNEFRCRVNFNPSVSVMEKVVYDKYAEWKAHHELV